MDDATIQWMIVWRLGRVDEKLVTKGFSRHDTHRLYVNLRGAI